MEGGPPCFPPGSSCPVVLRHQRQPRLSCFPYRTLTFSGVAFQPLRVQPRLSRASPRAGPPTPLGEPLPVPERFGLSPVRSPLLRASRLISLRRATKMFQFTHCPSVGPVAADLRPSRRRGYPIRRLRDHRLPAAPPERFAARRVLLRPSAPRHPPRTLLACAASRDTCKRSFRAYPFCLGCLGFAFAPPSTTVHFAQQN